MQARRMAAEAMSSDSIGLAGALALESIALARRNNRTPEADALEVIGSALRQLPLQALTQGR